MKTAVIYVSKTGFTRRYAEWIGEELPADCFELADAKGKSFKEYDTIIFGGWLCAGKISKIEWFRGHLKQWQGKKLLLYFTGGSTMAAQDVSSIQKGVDLGDIPVFYCPGGINYENMSISSRCMMKAFAKMLASKEDKTKEEMRMAEMISRSFDLSDVKYIEPILASIREADKEK